MENAHVPEALKPQDDVHEPIGTPRRSATDSPHRRYGDRNNPNDPLRKASRTSGGPDRSVEHSPLHRNQAKASWERKGPSEGGYVAAPSTPGRFKPKGGGQGDETPDKVIAVPKFGGWDESDPSSADGFSDIFKKVSEEKRTEAAKVPQITDDSMYINSYSQGGSNSKSSSCWCFSWCKK